MMRSGLRKPGAIPFLALIVFSLLSLVPSSFTKNGYIGYHRNDVRRADFSRIVNDRPVDSRLRVRASSGLCWPWLSDGSYQPRSRPVAVDTTASPSSFEISPISADDHGSTVDPWKDPSTSTLTLGIRAFTTFFIQQLDDHKLLPSFSSRNLSPVETAPLHRPLLSPPLQRTVYDNNYTISTTDKINENYELEFCDRFSDSWQRVCHTASDLYVQMKALSATYGIVDSSFLCTNSGLIHPLNSTFSTPFTQLDQRIEAARLKILLPNKSHPSSSILEPTFGFNSTYPPKPITMDSQDAGVGRDPKQVRGSCMAIVIGLVVGIMWF